MEVPKEPITETGELHTNAATTAAADTIKEAETAANLSNSIENSEAEKNVRDELPARQENVAALELGAVKSQDSSDNIASNLSIEASPRVEYDFLGETPNTTSLALDSTEPISKDAIEEPNEPTTDTNKLSLSNAAAAAVADTTHLAELAPLPENSEDNSVPVSAVFEDSLKPGEPTPNEDVPAPEPVDSKKTEDTSDHSAFDVSTVVHPQTEEEVVDLITDVAFPALGSTAPIIENAADKVAEDEGTLATVHETTVEDLEVPASASANVVTSSTEVSAPEPKPEPTPPQKPTLSPEARQQLRERRRKERQRRAALTPSQRCIEDYERKTAKETRAARTEAQAKAAAARAAWLAELAARKIGQRPQRLVNLSLKVAAAPRALVARTLEDSLVSKVVYRSVRALLTETRLAMPPTTALLFWHLHTMRTRPPLSLVPATEAHLRQRIPDLEASFVAQAAAKKASRVAQEEHTRAEQHVKVMREALAAYESGTGGENEEFGGEGGGENGENTAAAAGATATGGDDNDIVASAAEAEEQALTAEEKLREATSTLKEAQEMASTQLAEAIANDLEARIDAYEAKYGAMGLRKEWQRLLNAQTRCLQGVTRESSAIAAALGVPDPSLTFLASSKRGGARARRLKSEVATMNGASSPDTEGAAAQPTAETGAALAATNTKYNGWLPRWSVKPGHAQTVLTEAGDGARKLLLQKEQPLQFALVERFAQHLDCVFAPFLLTLRHREVDTSFARALVPFIEPLRDTVEDRLIKYLGAEGCKRLVVAASNRHPVGEWGRTTSKEYGLSASMQGLGRTFVAMKIMKRRRARYHATLVLQKHFRAFIARNLLVQAKLNEQRRLETNTVMGEVYNSTGLNEACGRTKARVLGGPGGPGPPVGCYEVCRRLAAALRDGVPMVIGLGLGTALIQQLNAAADETATRIRTTGSASTEEEKTSVSAAAVVDGSVDEVWGGDVRWWEQRRSARNSLRPSYAHGLPRPNIVRKDPLSINQASQHKCALLKTAAVLCADPRGREALVKEGLAPTLCRLWSAAQLERDEASIEGCLRVALPLIKGAPPHDRHMLASDPKTSPLGGALLAAALGLGVHRSGQRGGDSSASASGSRNGSRSGSRVTTSRVGGGGAVMSSSPSRSGIEVDEDDEGEMVTCDLTVTLCGALALDVLAAFLGDSRGGDDCWLAVHFTTKTQIVAELLRLIDSLASARSPLSHPIRYAGRVRLGAHCLHAREAAPAPKLADAGRMPLHVLNAARSREEAAGLERFRSLRDETGVLEKAASLLFTLGQTRAGQASALAEGGPQTVIKLLECSLWPAATAVGCRAITALARTRKQKVAMVRAGVLPLLHQHLLFGDALQVRPCAIAAVETLAETIKPLEKGGQTSRRDEHDLEDEIDVPFIEDDDDNEDNVQLSKVDMQVFLTAWSSGAAVMAYGAERRYKDEPHVVVSNPVYKQREGLHSSYDFD